MEVFRFRYETLLEHRRRMEETRQRDLALLLRTRMIIHDQIRAMQDTVRHSKRSLGEGLTGRVDLDGITAFAVYSGQVENRGRELAMRLGDLEERIIVARQALQDAMRECKIMKKLREKHYTEWKQRRDRREAAEMDEIATLR
ncbi:MAG: flagellar export protein FliJ, partial [Rhodospirillales bacterium]|nr:flagellar export protein FliJ [Rhodospirillales bacterium]